MFVCSSDATSLSQVFPRLHCSAFVAVAVLATFGCSSPTENPVGSVGTDASSGVTSNASGATSVGPTSNATSGSVTSSGVTSTNPSTTTSPSSQPATGSEPAPSSTAPTTSTANDSAPTTSNGTTGGESGSDTTTTAVTSDTKDHETDNHDHCVMGYEPDISNDSITPGFAEYTENGQTDAVLQPEIIAWMEKKEWQEAHFQWHNVRRCGGGGFGGGGGGSDFNPCDIPALLPDANECENAQDGYEFLVMHRHMIQALKQLFPSHTDQFEGWDKWPAASDYPELLRPYFNEWSQQVQQNAAILDNIEDNLDMFADEGELGMWFQCGGLSGGIGASSLHGALHFNGYPQNNQSHSVANQRRNLDSFVFWKLHGYMDKIWERYRIAKGQQPTEEALQTELRAQCMEMDALAHYIPGGEETDPPEEIPEEEGFFHDVVRPGLEDARCATCHGEGEDAGLRLGFNVSSKEIVERLVNVDSAYAQGYKLVVPGDPDNSWLYLKAAGLSPTSGATCQGVMNCTQAMPPGGGAPLPETDLANLRQWIEDGAPVPTEVP